MARGVQPGFGHAVFAGLRDDFRIIGIKEDIELCLIEVLDVFGGSGLFYPVSIVEHHAEIADAAHTGFRTYRRLPCFDPWITEDALFTLPGFPVVIDLLVRAARYTHAPAPAFFLIDQDDAILLPLIDRTRRARCDASGVKAVLAQAR